jgi:adenylate cyclase
MAGKRAKFLETRYFGLVLGLLVALIMLAVSSWTGLLTTLEYKTLDALFNLKTASRGTSLQKGTVVKASNPQISQDIQIVGVDTETLSSLGSWPFPRGKHGDLLNSFSRIKNADNRENAVLLDIIFSSETGRPDQDEALATAMKDSGRVFVETSLSFAPDENSTAEAMASRGEVLMERLGTVTRISGNWIDMVPFFAQESPIEPFSNAAKGYGHATFWPAPDKVFRKVPLIGKLSRAKAELPLESLTPDFPVDAANHERLAWQDSDLTWHTVPNPLTAAALESLKKDMEARAPKVETEGGGSSFSVSHFQDVFVPSLTLSLALNYFGKTLSDVEVKIGDRIRIDSPTRFDAATGSRIPYEIQIKAPIFDEAGNLITPGTMKPVPFIEIPVDSNCQMYINFMGPPSGEGDQSIQTFPIRSYSAYSETAPSPDSTTWKRNSRGLENKVILVGAFAHGMASDDKQTPMGIMFGIEVHANALNTIMMDNFVHEAPAWLDTLALFLLVLGIALLSSRPKVPLFASLVAVLVLDAAYFLAISTVFDSSGLLLAYPGPAIAVILTFVAIIVYKAMTEEKDKQRIQATFGQYVSPDVADVLVQGGMPSLGGVDKMITVFFSDIRGFTSLSETMTPQELVNHLNNYLEEMTNIIMEYRGTLDKYVGDEVMCYWGAPVEQADHAELACKCALAQMKRLGELNAQWPANRQINIGIGLNSGIMTWANMGSTKRKNITLMGDNVNLGARLEGTNKEYGTRVIISENTYSLVKDKFIVRELDNIRVKGKNKPVLMFELVDCLEELVPPAAAKKVKK